MDSTLRRHEQRQCRRASRAQPFLALNLKSSKWYKNWLIKYLFNSSPRKLYHDNVGSDTEEPHNSIKYKILNFFQKRQQGTTGQLVRIPIRP